MRIQVPVLSVANYSLRPCLRRAPAVQVIPRFRKKTSRDLRISFFCSHKHTIANAHKKLADPLTFFLVKKRGVTVMWQAEIVHVISNAPSWRPNISSGIFAPAVRVPRALPALFVLLGI